MSRKSEGGCARDGLFLWLIDFRTQRHKIEPGGVVEGSEAVRQRNKNVTSISRRSSPHRWPGGLSIRGGPGYGPHMCPESVGYCSRTTVYSSTAVPFFRVLVYTLSKGARPTQGPIIVSRVRRRDMARSFDSGEGSTVSDSVWLVSMPTTRGSAVLRCLVTM